MSTEAPPAWRVVRVEDDDDMLHQVKEYLEGEDFEFGALRVTGIKHFDGALALLKERKVDLIILDVFRGAPEGYDTAGLPVLEQWCSTGFAPVILHTALPEGVEEYAGTYEHEMFGPIEVRLEDGHLHLRFGAPFEARLEHWHFDVFLARWRDRQLGEALVQFRLDGLGKVGRVEVEGLGEWHRAAGRAP